MLERADFEPNVEYRQILERELNARRAKNKRYSLRAFARDLDLSPSMLSEILASKHAPSRQSAALIARRLQLAADEAEFFCNLVECAHGRNPERRQRALAGVEAYKARVAFFNLDVDQFKLISDWFHLAILELVKVADFQSDAAWIGEKLGIAEEEVDAALSRLFRLELLAEKSGKFIPLQPKSLTSPGCASDAVRRFHRQILTKASTALSSQPLEQRTFNAAVVSIDRKRIPEVKKRIESFLQRLSEDLASDPCKDDVYSLAIQFFAVTDKNHADSRHRP